MARLMIYLIPALMDLVVAIMLFTNASRTADVKLSPTATACVTAAWAAVYVLCCQIVGRFVTRRNAAWLVFGACLFIGGCECLLIVTPSITMIYVVMVLLGIGTALIFVPFQVFMKAVDGNHRHGISGPIGLYTFAWSAGYAIGPFVAGLLLYYASWQWCHGVGAAVSIISAVAMLMLRHLAHVENAPDEAEELNVGSGMLVDVPAEPHPSGPRPDLAWLAWVGSGIGFGAMIMIRALFPSTGKELEVSKAAQGIILGLLTGTQAIMGLLLMKSRYWPYRAKSVGLFVLVGMAGLAVFGIAGSFPKYQVWIFGTAAVLFGVYSGSVCFYLVFHALIHPTRGSRYVAINESVVGTVSTIAPLAGGLVAQLSGRAASPYFAAIGVLLLAGVLQVITHRRHPWPVSAAPGDPVPKL